MKINNEGQQIETELVPGINVVTNAMFFLQRI